MKTQTFSYISNNSYSLSSETSGKILALLSMIGGVFGAFGEYLVSPSQQILI